MVPLLYVNLVFLNIILSIFHKSVYSASCYCIIYVLTA